MNAMATGTSMARAAQSNRVDTIRIGVRSTIPLALAKPLLATALLFGKRPTLSVTAAEAANWPRRPCWLRQERWSAPSGAAEAPNGEAIQARPAESGGALKARVVKPRGTPKARLRRIRRHRTLRGNGDQKHSPSK